MGVADHRGRSIDDTCNLENDAQVGCSSREVLADLWLDLAPAERDPIFARHGNLIPPFKIILGVFPESAVGMVAEIVAEAPGDLDNVVRVSLKMIVGLAVVVLIPLAEDLIPCLDSLAEVPAPGLVAFQVVLEPFDPHRVAGRVAA